MKMSNLKLRRVIRALTQAQVAEKIGCTRQALSNYERGSRKVPQAAKVELAKVYGCKPNEL